MESNMNFSVISDELLEEYFSGYDSSIIFENNRYFIIDYKSKSHRKENNKPKLKGKVSKMEWFESLDIKQRVEAVSTIATGNYELLSLIKKDIERIEKKHRNTFEMEDQGASNEDYLCMQNNRSIRSHYIPHAYNRVFDAGLWPRFKEIIENITFLDFKEQEDTITVMESLVEDSAEFFNILEATWQLLSQSSESQLPKSSKSKS